MFDPYEQWLGIPKTERPITFYSLLGLTPKQAADPDAVDAAAAKMAERVSAHKKGPQAEVAARLLRDIAKGRAVLANEAKRKEYDAHLRKKAAPKPAADDGFEVVEETSPAAEDDIVEDAAVAEEDEEEKPAPAKKKRKKHDDDEEPEEPEEQKKKKPVLLFVGLGVVALLLLGGGGIAAVLLLKKDDKTVASGPAPRTEPQVTQPRPSEKEPARPTEKDKPKPEAPKPEAPKPEPPKPPEAPKPAPPKPEAPKVVKLPVPTSEAQAAAEKTLKEAFKTEYAKTKPEDRAALAAKFLVPGREDRNDPAGWFVFLREARDLAIEAKRPRLAFEAIADMDRYFVVDPIDMRLKAVGEITKGNNETAVAATFRAAANLVQQAYSEENFDAAKKYLDAVEAPVREIKGEQVVKRLRELRAEHGDYVREFDAVKAARERLKQTPDDPEANTTVGRYQCFMQGDWDRGLPMLVKGSDRALKDTATKDLANPADVKDQLAVADTWWFWGTKLRERGQFIAMRRARLWYDRAGATATDVDRQHIIDRIMEAQRREIIRFQRLLPGSFYARGPEDRVLLLREGGGNIKSEEAVERGLDWLAAHQSPEGYWLSHAFDKTAKCKCTETSDKDQKHDIAGTAFGLLPFLGAGYTHKQGKYMKEVYRGAMYLLKKQNKTDGNFSDNAYENALASTAIIELYGMTKDRDLAARAQAAANYIALAQFSDGSWGYSKGTKGDLSVSGWQFTAMKAAAYAGLSVPQETFDRLSKFLDAVAEPGGLGYGYNAPGAGPATSAVGLLCREFLDWGPGHPGLTKAMDNLLRTENYLAKDKNNIYAAFYIMQVAHHLGGERWEKWNNAVRDVLIDFQDKGDVVPHQKGSWSPRGDAYAKQGGRLMYTSLSLIMLEAYYYHVPLYGYGPYVLLD
jgi:hypothetical protein